MYARLIKVSVGMGFETRAQELADDLAPLISVQQGSQAVTVFADHRDGEYVIYELWDTEEHADNAAEVVRPRLDDHLAGYITAPVETRSFEVLWSH